jgi:hypothetical protein
MGPGFDLLSSCVVAQYVAPGNDFDNAPRTKRDAVYAIIAAHNPAFELIFRPYEIFAAIHYVYVIFVEFRVHGTWYDA